MLADPDSLPDPVRYILFNVRLPYAVMAMLVGASLGLTGAEMPTAPNNVLASPFTLGVSAAATLGTAYHRFVLSTTDVEGLLAVQRVIVFCEGGRH
ncbi:iron chelate uptake ABC transporter family permease subunit [Nitratireductor luteus]|uniref:iron chelate uptake ABC transporter family permease subunit n=1 Tax=Nitratireductor luteus TaxID=2976980 RepID=UPI00223FDE33|nr:iron chelate uptake ABC transporter family permease subunit [Nitratireductor luteus]